VTWRIKRLLFSQKLRTVDVEGEAITLASPYATGAQIVGCRRRSADIKRAFPVETQTLLLLV
jgi:hypothetical protein